jgi:S-adenosylmethionine:tRNA ribosyltransferase-isomerase
VSDARDTDVSDVDVPDYRVDSYEYALPNELIAQRPTAVRTASRLLVLPAAGTLTHRTFADLAEMLRPGDLLVANDTRVLRARIRAKRAKGGAAEVLLLGPDSVPGRWEALVRPGRRIRPGDALALDGGASIHIEERTPDGGRIVRFEGVTAEDAMERFGSMPLPPYITEAPSDVDERYQTVYARIPGSAAAPTAGLHFTPELIERLQNLGVAWKTLTLDVGTATFRPVSADDVREHRMHHERFAIPPGTAAAVTAAKREGRRVIAVGTTALRALEAAADDGGAIAAGADATDLFIYHPYRFRIVDALITNFHLPRSTLLMLVCAFAGRERAIDAYKEAVRLGYRFFSFGDAMFVERRASV